VRRPNGRIGRPDPSQRAAGAEQETPIARQTEAFENAGRRGNRTGPTGKGLYICRGGDCLTRLLTEKRFKRMFVESMEEACLAGLRASLHAASSASGGATAVDERVQAQD
jgi:hypothetical protein